MGQSPGNPQATFSLIFIYVLKRSPNRSYILSISIRLAKESFSGRCFCLSPLGTEMCSILTLVGVGAGIKSPFISFFGCRVKTVQGQFHRVQLDQKKL